MAFGPPRPSGAIAISAAHDAERVLAETSRTFAIPIARLPAGLKEAVAGAYLCMRSIDEIEDHALLPAAEKARLLRAVSAALQQGPAADAAAALARALAGAAAPLPEVTLRLGEWAELPPAAIRPRVHDAIAAMADRMAVWAETCFSIADEADLDRYTYAVAGAVGLLLSDLWAWHDGTRTDRADAVGFGRGLQAVNILRNRAEDLAAGVDFFPPGWSAADLSRYARQNLAIAERYTAHLPDGPIREFSAIPLALAQATLAALDAGRSKLSRAEVERVVAAALAR